MHYEYSIFSNIAIFDKKYRDIKQSNIAKPYVALVVQHSSQQKDGLLPVNCSNETLGQHVRE